MIAFLASLALATAAAPATNVAPQLNTQQQLALTCSAALATTAQRQAAGDAAALAYPPLAERGREFFVRVSAKVMDETGLSRAQLRHALTSSAAALREQGELAAVMPTCLDMLVAAGL